MCALFKRCFLYLTVCIVGLSSSISAMHHIPKHLKYKKRFNKQPIRRYYNPNKASCSQPTCGECVQGIKFFDTVKKNDVHSMRNMLISCCNRAVLAHEQDASGNTPMHYVRSKEAVDILIRYARNTISVCNKENYTPLFTVTAPDAVTALIHYGANVSHTASRNVRGLFYYDLEEEEYVPFIPRTYLVTPFGSTVIDADIKKIMTFVECGVVNKAECKDASLMALVLARTLGDSKTKDTAYIRYMSIHHYLKHQ